MFRISDKCRFWLPIWLLAGLGVYASQQLIRAHVCADVSTPRYAFTNSLIACRGSIYSCYGKNYPFARSVPFWEYYLDPVSLTNTTVKAYKQRRTTDEIITSIASALKQDPTLKIDRSQVEEMAKSGKRRGWRHQLLAISSDLETHRQLSSSTNVAGVAIEDRQVRQYPNGRRLSHVIGGISAEYQGYAGLELYFDKQLTGKPGVITGMRNAMKNELYDRRSVSVAPTPGNDLYLTIDHNIQVEAESALLWGLSEYGAAYGWCIVMDARNGAVLAMASFPDFDPVVNPKKDQEDERLNRAISFNYEPGSVMKVITAASAFDCGRANPNTVYTTNRDDSRYYRLPGDGSHKWPPTMTIRDAIVHSSNIVIGKLGYDLGSKCLWSYMRGFGFGDKIGIELPGEERGILQNPHKSRWDLASCSRIPIGQAIAVTGIQLAGAYQAIANNGVRMQPYIVDRIIDSKGEEVFRHTPRIAGRPISPRAARTIREVMLDVATKKGTARRAAIRGYSVAGKTGTAQKHLPGIKGYAPGLYRASFCGIVPSGVVKRRPEDTEPAEARLVILVTLDFNEKVKYHQGGNSSGPVFRRIAMKSLRYLLIPPDRPDELSGLDDELEQEEVFEDEVVAEEEGNAD